MKGAKPTPLGNVIPMKGDMEKPVLEAPDMLTELGRQVWDELAPELTRLDRLKIHYRYQFASYCEAVANFIRATNDIALHGVWYETKTRNGTQHKKTAAWTAQNEAMNQMRRDAALFGLTPVDESRISSGGQGDLFDKLMDQLKGGTIAPA
ncbi:MAG: phage terminase small subunit P27 family [Shimia sp.]|nr:phage terminase small subunit P27 family [Shimia sp.]MCP4826226.1 phage terminase small subunit P27 family [Shimia sp.]